MAVQYDKRLTMHVWIVCALGLFIDGYDLYISAVAEPFIKTLYHPSAFMIGLTQAAALIGAAFGAVTLGRMSDWLGRKSLLIFNLIFFVVIALLSACAWNDVSLCVFRFLIGFGVGADYPICAAYLAEMVPPKKTNQLIASAMFINCLASPVGALVGWMMYSYHPSLEVWRWMFASGVIPALIGLLLRAKLPESFLWQAHQKIKKSHQQENSLYKKLFSPALIKTTLCLSLSWFLLDISYYGIGLFTPFILQAVHISNQADLLNSAGSMLASTFLLNSFVMLGALCGIFFIAKINPFVLQKIGFVLSFLGLFILSLSHTHFSSLNMGMIFGGFILFNFFVNFGPGVTTYLLPATMYSTDVKATGHGFAAGLGKFGAFVGTIFLPVLQMHIGIYFTVGVLSITLLLGWLLTHLLSQSEFQQAQHAEEWVTQEAFSSSY